MIPDGVIPFRYIAIGGYFRHITNIATPGDHRWQRIENRIMEDSYELANVSCVDPDDGHTFYDYVSDWTLVFPEPEWLA